MCADIWVDSCKNEAMAANGSTSAPKNLVNSFVDESQHPQIKASIELLKKQNLILYHSMKYDSF